MSRRVESARAEKTLSASKAGCIGTTIRLYHVDVKSAPSYLWRRYFPSTPSARATAAGWRSAAVGVSRGVGCAVGRPDRLVPHRVGGQLRVRGIRPSGGLQQNEPPILRVGTRVDLIRFLDADGLVVADLA